MGGMSNVKCLFIVEHALSYTKLVHRHAKQLKQIIQIKHNIVKNPNWPEQTSWLFTSVAKDLNSGVP